MRSYRKISWLLSILIHLIPLVILALLGVFNQESNAQNQANDETVYMVEENDDRIYDTQASGGGGGSGESANDIVLDDGETGAQKEKSAVDEILNDVKNMQQSKSVGISKNKENDVSTADKSGEQGGNTDSKGDGNTGGGAGAGNGVGSGKGVGSGTGGGTGDGSGTGTGSGTGSGDSDLVATVAPVPVYTILPAYPETMRSSGIEGTVTISFLVSASGAIESASVVFSSGQSVFDSAALSAARQWRFSPAKNSHGKAVRCRITQPFHFRLDS